LMRDLIDQLLPKGRQLKTNAHPLVEITLMRQKNRTLMHFINISGHSQTAYFSPAPMTDIKIQVKGAFQSARAIRADHAIALARGQEYTTFTLPSLKEYELIELQ